MNLEGYKRREKHNIAESTLRSRVSAIKRFDRFRDSEEEPTAEEVEDWVDSMIEMYEMGEMKPGTIRQYFNAVKYYFQKMTGGSEDIEHISDWIPSGETNHGEYLEEEELEEMLQGMFNYRDFAMFKLMYEYGRRPGEIRLLNEEDISLGDEDAYTVEKDEELDEGEKQDILDEKGWEKGTITFIILKKQELLRATFELKWECREALLRYRDIKGSYTQDRGEYLDEINATVQNPEEVWESSEVSPLFTTSHGRISYDSIWRKIKHYAESAGIDKNITPKSMRHSKATHLDWEGHSPGEIARHQLVHEPDTDVISAYIHDRGEDKVRTPLGDE